MSMRALAAAPRHRKCTIQSSQRASLSACFDDLGHSCAGLFTPRRGLALTATAVLLFLPVVNSSWRASPDAALYLELGESLARGGEYVFNGEPHTYVPPGYPLLVAAAARILGPGFFSYRLFMGFLGLLTALAGYRLIGRLSGPDAALLLGGLFVVSHELLTNATCTTADVPFALATLVSLNAVLSAGTSSRREMYTVVAGLAVGIPALVRVNGWGVPPAAAIYLFCAWADRRLLSRCLWILLFVFLAVIPGTVWEWHKASFPLSSSEVSYGNALLGRSIWTHLDIITRSLWEYASEMTYAITGISVKTGFLELLVPALVVAGMVIAFRRGERLLVPLVAIQMFGLSLSPAGSRYLVFLLPALILFLAVGLLHSGRMLSERLSGRYRGLLSGLRVLVCMIGACALVNLGHDAHTIFTARNPVERGGAERTRDLPFFAAARWIRANASDGVVMTMHPRVVHYLAGIPSVELVRSGVPEHKVWLNAQDEIRRLVSRQGVTLLFSDSTNTHLHDDVMRAIEAMGIGLDEVTEARVTPRFRLWRLIHTNTHDRCPGTTKDENRGQPVGPASCRSLFIQMRMGIIRTPMGRGGQGETRRDGIRLLECG